MSAIAEYAVQTGVTLLAVFALAALILYAGRRFSSVPAGGALTLRGKLPLENRRAIYLVQIGTRVLVVGTSESGLNKLAELTPEELPAIDSVTPTSFSKVLGEALKRPRKQEDRAKPPAQAEPGSPRA